MQLEIGLDAIASYRRLSYTAWHAIAEFVDNATQAYFDNRESLDEVYREEDEKLNVNIAYEKAEGDSDGLLRVVDNSIGMSQKELDRAMHIAKRPKDPSGRSRYGLGMKTAACWIGDLWSVRTKKLGETTEHRVTVDVPRIVQGDADLQYQSTGDKDPEQHYTIIEVKKHNQVFRGRTLSKIKQFLRSMYRVDLREGWLRLTWRGQELEWQGFEDQLLEARDGTRYRKNFSFSVNGKDVEGWVGVLGSGSRSKAGFSILHSKRVIRGYPDSWRPASLYGQMQGTNDLVNQRLIGEIHLDDFEVSHTKDDIIWQGEEEELVEEGLLEHCGDYRKVARDYRKSDDEEDERGPSETDKNVAVDEFEDELQSEELSDKVELEEVPEPEIAEEAFRSITDSADERSEAFSASIGQLDVKGFLATDLSSNDPYIAIDSPQQDKLIVIVNMQHPHIRSISNSEGLLNYLRHCTYDALSEWKAISKVGKLSPDTVKLIKDGLLRVGFQMEVKRSEREAEEAAQPIGGDGDMEES